MKTLIIGDMHWRDSLSYSEYIKDGRVSEKEKIISFILDASKDCENVVMLGDLFHSKNNSSETNRQVTAFLESFGDKEVYVINGNHCKKGDGQTAIDFLREVNKPNWHIITTTQDLMINGKKVTFLPFLVKSEIKAKDNLSAEKRIINSLQGGDILFHHFAVSDTEASHGVLTNTFDEVVLSKKKLEKKYSWIIGGHIHTPRQYGQTIVAGSVFTSEVGEMDKKIWKLDMGKMSIKSISLPGRPILKIENPKTEELDKIDEECIIKVVVTSKDVKIEEIKDRLKKFDAHILLEQYPNERKKIHIEDSAMDFSTENLLDIYAKEKGVDIKILMDGYNIIKT